jgi:hypothetical protein
MVPRTVQSPTECCALLLPEREAWPQRDPVQCQHTVKVGTHPILPSKYA